MLRLWAVFVGFGVPVDDVHSACVNFRIARWTLIKGMFLRWSNLLFQLCFSYFGKRLWFTSERFWRLSPHGWILNVENVIEKLLIFFVNYFFCRWTFFYHKIFFFNLRCALKFYFKMLRCAFLFLYDLVKWYFFLFLTRMTCFVHICTRREISIFDPTCPCLIWNSDWIVLWFLFIFVFK